MLPHLLTLPDELLHLIFKQLQSSSFNYRGPRVARLSNVCRRFDRVLRQPSELWEEIMLNTGADRLGTEDTAQYRASVAQFLLPRLNSITKLYIYEDAGTEVAMLVLSLLPNLQGLTVCLPDSRQPREALVSAVGRTCRGLTELKLDVVEDTSESDEGYEWDDCANLQPLSALTALKRLDIHDQLVLESPGWLMALLVSLTRLVCPLQPGQDLRPLASLTSLCKLDVTLTDCRGPHAQKFMQIFSEAFLRLPALQKLSLSGLGSAKKLAFGRGSHVTKVVLDDVDNIADSFEAVRGLTNLRCLSVCPAWRVPHDLANSEGLTIVPAVTQLSGLTKLDIENAHLPVFPYFLQSLPQLRCLDLFQVSCHDIQLDIKRLAAFPALHNMSIKCAEGSTFKLGGCHDSEVVKSSGFRLYTAPPSQDVFTVKAHVIDQSAMMTLTCLRSLARMHG